MVEDSATTFDLATRVNVMTRAYVLRRSEARGEMKWQEFLALAENDPRRVAYRDTREKVCADAFLALRSRRSREDFVEYFTATICSVPQFLPATEYAGLAEALLDGDRWEEVKALAMLALSGLSRV